MLKKDATRWNLFAIPYAFFLITSMGGYLNVQIVYLLRDPEAFNVEPERQGRVISNIMLVAICCGMAFTAVAGYLYDIFFRKVTIFTAAVIAAICLFVCPHTAPSLFWLTFVRAVIQMALATIGSHPMIMDYVKKESRGKAAALQNLGNLLGETFAMSVLFSISKKEGVSQNEAFSIAALMLGVLSLVTLLIVRDPTIQSVTTQISGEVRRE